MNLLRLRIRPDAPIDLHAPLRQAPSVVTVRRSLPTPTHATTPPSDTVQPHGGAAHPGASAADPRAAAA